jgi:hypothetical protein
MDLMQPPYQESGALIERPGSFGSLRAFSGHQSLRGVGDCAAVCMNLMLSMARMLLYENMMKNTKHASQLTGG